MSGKIKTFHHEKHRTARRCTKKTREIQQEAGFKDELLPAGPDGVRKKSGQNLNNYTRKARRNDYNSRALIFLLHKGRI